MAMAHSSTTTHKLRRQIERLRNTEYGEDCRQYADNNKQQTAHALAHPA
jgi:hypothetical protein